MNLSPKIITDKKRVRPVKSEVQKLQCDNNKLKNNTQWIQKNTFKRGITKTIKWFLKNKNFFDFRSYHV